MSDWQIALVIVGVLVEIIVFTFLLAKFAQYRHRDVIAWNAWCRANGLPEGSWPPVGFGEKYPALLRTQD